MRLFPLRQPRQPGDLFTRRILELAKGHTAEEVAELMYQDMVRAGAWVADIGLWKSRYIQDVMSRIEKLAEEGKL